MNPGSGFKVYATLPPEPQVPSQHLPGPWVSFLWPLSLTREGNDQLISYRWTSGRLKRALSFCSGPALAGGQKEWGGRGRGDPSHWLPGMTSPGGGWWGNKHPPLPATSTPKGVGSHKTGQIRATVPSLGLRCPPRASLQRFGCCYHHLKTQHPRPRHGPTDS